MAALKATRVNMNQGEPYQHGSCPKMWCPINGIISPLADEAPAASFPQRVPEFFLG
jgi:hypothetical protein